MSLNTLLPANELPTDTYMINGPVTIGDSPTYTTNLRGRTYMKDVQPIDELANPAYQPQIVCTYESYQENWLIATGDAGQVLTIVNAGSGVGKPQWVESCCPITRPSYEAFFNMTINGADTFNTTSTVPLSGRKLINTSVHPHRGTEMYELRTTSTFDSITPGTGAGINIILETGVHSKYGEPPYHNIRRWHVESIHIYDRNENGPKLADLQTRFGTFEHTRGEIKTYTHTDVAQGGTYYLNIQWLTKNAGKTIMFLILRKTPASTLLTY